MPARASVLRWCRFNAVGAIGFGLQLGVLALLLRLGVNYLAATALAVEAAVLHNYAWHERWTWKDRPLQGAARVARLWRFHLLNGAVSLIGNVLLMRLLVGTLHLPPLAANLLAVLLCSLVNYLGSVRLVFDPGFRIQDERFRIRDERCRIRDQRLAIRVAERSVSATNVSVALVQPPVGSVGDPTTKRFS